MAGFDSESTALIDDGVESRATFFVERIVVGRSSLHLIVTHH